MRALLASLASTRALATAVCGSSAAPPPPGTSRVRGELRFDSRAGFAVVDVEASEPPAEELEVKIGSSGDGGSDALRAGGAVVDPKHGACGAGGRILVRNETDATHVVSHPATRRLVEVEPRDAAVFEIESAGEQHLYLLDAPAASATIFAAPGPYAVVRSSGRFELSGVDPRRRTLHAWHLRLPPVDRVLGLAPDESVEVVLELGVGLATEGVPAR